MFLPSCSATVRPIDLGMPLVKISAVLLAICLCGAWAFAFSAAAADKPAQGAPIEQSAQPSAKIAEPEPTSWKQVVLHTARQAGEVIAAGYKRAPVLVTILSALLILPAVALASVTVQTVARRSGERRSRKAALSASGAGESLPARRPSQAWLSIDGEAEGTHPVAGEMIRIGRHPDNEVWLTDTSVHRYHAVIHRTEADFFITDLSGEAGNGVRINGTRRAQSPLSDGDIIELGKARITFASAPI
jgi:FHA domain